MLLAFQDALDGSMRYDYGGPEPLNALANLRLSQSKPEEAAKSAEEAFRRLGLCGAYTQSGVIIHARPDELLACCSADDWSPMIRLCSAQKVGPMERGLATCAQDWTIGIPRLVD